MWFPWSWLRPTFFWRTPISSLIHITPPPNVLRTPRPTVRYSEVALICRFGWNSLSQPVRPFSIQQARCKQWTEFCAPTKGNLQQWWGQKAEVRGQTTPSPDWNISAAIWWISYSYGLQKLNSTNLSDFILLFLKPQQVLIESSPLWVSTSSLSYQHSTALSFVFRMQKTVLISASHMQISIVSNLWYWIKPGFPSNGWANQAFSLFTRFKPCVESIVT